MKVYEVDYLIKDKAKFDAAPKEVPSIVVAEDFHEAVKVAKKFEDDNLSMHKCTQSLAAKAALQSKVKGLEPVKAEA